MRTLAFLSDELHQLQAGGATIRFEAFCLGVEADATADLLFGRYAAVGHGRIGRRWLSGLPF
jgi:hypothetical protein